MRLLWSSRYRTDFGRKSAKSSLETTMSPVRGLKPLSRPPAAAVTSFLANSPAKPTVKLWIGPPATCVMTLATGRRRRYPR